MAVPTTSSLLHAANAGFAIPPHDKVAFTYVSAGVADDDKVATIVYSKLGDAEFSNVRTVATVTIAYVAATNNVTTMTLTV